MEITPEEIIVKNLKYSHLTGLKYIDSLDIRKTVLLESMEEYASIKLKLQSDSFNEKLEAIRREVVVRMKQSSPHLMDYDNGYNDNIIDVLEILDNHIKS